MFIQIKDQSYDIDLIAIDKDGTLINFEEAWAGILRNWIAKLTANASPDIVADLEALHHDLCRTIGYDPIKQYINPDGLAAVTTVAKINTAAAVVLHQHGYLWPRAEQLVSNTSVDHFELTADMILPVGNVAESIKRFKQHGIKIAVATNDDRQVTLDTLPFLGIADQVDLLSCGDDPWPNKPDPASLYHIAAETGIPVERMLMVGDTASDMMTGRAAGVAASVGITGGGGQAAVLAQHADIVIDSIDDIKIKNG